MASGVHRSPRGPRRPCLRCHRHQLGQRGTVTRRLAGHSNVPDLSRASSAGGRSFDRPSNTQMEPTRPTICAILSPRRAAHLQRYTDKTESFFSLGFLPRWGFNEESGTFRGFGRKASGSFEHLVGFAAGRCRLRRAWSSGRRRAVGSTNVALRWCWARSGSEVTRGARLERLRSRCSRGRSIGVGLLRRTV